MGDCIVVGSGPAGVSAAHALVEKGRRVVMLDAGLRLEPERERAVEALTRDPARRVGRRPYRAVEGG